MSTGDINNSYWKMVSNLKKLKYSPILQLEDY